MKEAEEPSTSRFAALSRTTQPKQPRTCVATMDAMETDSQHDTYDTIKSKCLAKLLSKLTTKLPSASEAEMRMLVDLWE